jgi:integrase
MARRRYSKRKRAGRDVYWTRYRDAYRKRIYLQAYSEEELVALLAEKQLEAKTAPAPAATRDITLAEFAEPWLRRVAADMKFATGLTYRSIYDTHLAPTLGSFKLREMTRQHIKLLINPKRDQDYSKATLRLIPAVLSGMLSEALEDEIVKTNAASAAGRRRSKHVDTPSEIESRASIRPFSESQVEDLLAGARDQQDRTLLTLLARTGLRPGEATALCWSDFDFTAREILVEGALYRGRLGTPKTGRRRRVDMSQELAKALTSLYTIREREKLQGQRTEIPDWAFCDRAGQPLAYPVVTAIFKRALRHAHLSGHTVYDLRHTFASLLLQNGAPSPMFRHKWGIKARPRRSNTIPTGFPPAISASSMA